MSEKKKMANKINVEDIEYFGVGFSVCSAYRKFKTELGSAKI